MHGMELQTGQWHSWNLCHTKINTTAPRHMNELEPDPVMHGMEPQQAKLGSGTPGIGATQENRKSRTLTHE